MLKVYERAVVNGTLITSEAYAAKFGRNDSYVLLTNGVMAAVVSVCVFKCTACNSNCVCPSEPFLISTKYEQLSSGFVDSYVEENLFNSLHKVRRTNVVIACNAQDIKQKLIAVHDIDENLFLIEPPKFYRMIK